MVFTSIAFLFLFLPLFLATHLAMPSRWRNVHLLAFSLLFYAVGGGVFTGFFILSIVLNYACGWLMARFPRARTTWLVATLIVDLALLVWFKYSLFFAQSANAVLGTFGLDTVPLPHVVLPMGISFFTFQGIAYVIDLYRGKHLPARSLTDFAVFKASFPQLIAGPIVRFPDVSAALVSRRISVADLYQGFLRLAWGLFRKLVFADSLGAVSDGVFGLPSAERSVPYAWLGLLCYTLQIYHDFGGYSDMAIGMGRMLGFSYPENFDQPYRSTSVTVFWRRWHMTLSTWFRDYLYIPLGGSRLGTWRTYRNLFLVFALCGLWHGAAYTFVIWGLFHGTLLVGERLLERHFSLRLSGWWGWLITFLAVMIGWVFFRAESLPHAVAFLQNLAGLKPVTANFFPLTFYLTWDRTTVLVLALATSWLPFNWVQARFAQLNPTSRIACLGIGGSAMAGYATIVLATNGYNPFIYFRF